MPQRIQILAAGPRGGHPGEGGATAGKKITFSLKKKKTVENSRNIMFFPNASDPSPHTLWIFLGTFLKVLKKKCLQKFTFSMF